MDKTQGPVGDHGGVYTRPGYDATPSLQSNLDFAIGTMRTVQTLIEQGQFEQARQVLSAVLSTPVFASRGK